MAKLKRIIKKKSEKHLIDEFISHLKIFFRKSVSLNKRFSFVLTGGSSPINLYKSLSKAKIDWKNIDLFWGDERFVSSKSNSSNYNLVKKHLLNKINIKNKNIYKINTNKKNASSSAIDYENKIKSYFKNKKISFDLILLGMGLDGHIASLFPNNIKLNKSKVVSTIIREDFERVTLNIKTINNSKQIALWLNDKKTSTVYQKIKNNKKIPVNYLNKKKLIIFSL